MARLSAKTSVGPFRTPTRAGAVESSALPGLAAPTLLASLLVLGWTADVRAERVCGNDWRAELVVAEGAVELVTSTGWVAAHSGATLCDGDILRTGPFSGALVWLPDGNGSTVKIHEQSTFRIHASQDATGAWYDVIVKVMRGLVHVISRDPRTLAFDTPFVNAGIQGTEFVIDTGPDRTTVDVIEGEVAMTNAAGVTRVAGGTRGSAAAGKKAEAAPSDVLRAIDWTRRLPPIVGGELPAPDAVPAANARPSADFHARRAASRLAAGALSEAKADLETALALDAAHGDALALRALILSAEGEREEAIELAAQAVSAAPSSAAAWLARSHAVGTGSTRAALESAETATRVAPDHAYAWSRVAELRLAREDYRGARSAAEHAVQLDPGLAHAYAVLGFVELRGGSTQAAEAAFRKAISVNAAYPYARLGLALSLYRQGATAAARREGEIAAALDPTNAALRGYIGKIYDEENRKVGATVLAIAKALNAEDPTGYYYDSLRKQHDNRLGEAFLDFSRAFEKTDRRSVHGSRFSLDEDLLARSAGVGRMHSALGFEQRGLLAAWRAMIADPTEYSSHRLAADLYSNRPGRQLARVNEVHQSILRQPLNVTPIQAQLGEVRPFVHDQAGLDPLAFREFNPLLRENGLSYQLSGVTAAHGTEGLDFSLNGLQDRSSYNLSVFDFHTDGFRPNNDFDERVVSALVQLRPSALTTITTEVRSSDIEKGDLALRFNPEAYFPSFRESESLDSLLVGVARRTPNGAWLGTVITERADAAFSGLGAYAQTGERRGTSFDVQYVTEAGAWNITTGVRYLDQRQTDELSAPPTLEILPSDAAAVSPMPLVVGDVIGRQHDVVHRSVYAYGNVELSPSVWATLGANVEEVESRSTSKQRLSPKLGVMWDITERTTLRAAAINGLQPPFVSRRNAQRTLEPTHVTGFNQQYFGPEGEEAWRYGIAVDHEFGDNLFGGLELSRRDVDTAILGIDSATSLTFRRPVQRDELSHFAYLYWLPTPSVSFAASYQYDEIDGGGSTLPEGFRLLETQRLPLEVTYSHPSGFSAGLEAQLVDQSGLFSAVSDDSLPPEHGEDRFWSIDLSLSYRLPSRHGQISLKALNLTDEQFRFQDIDPENPGLFPERMMQIAFTVSY